MATAENAVSTPSSTAFENKLRIPVDIEHGGLRLVVFGTFIIGFIVAYIGISAVLPVESINLLAVIGAFGITAILSTLLEKWLKTRWPSGRMVEVSPESIQITKHGRVEYEINPEKQVNVLLGRFIIKRRTKVKKGWYMVSCTLEQDNTYLPVYTFVSPDDFTTLILSERFERLMSKKELSGDGKDRDMRLAGQQRRLHQAENERWNYGAEMTLVEFQTYLQYLQTHFPKWMPSK